MGLFSAMNARRAAAKAASQVQVVSQVPGFRLWQGRYPPRDPRVREELYSYRSWVYIASNVIANRMAEIPIRMSEVEQNADGTETREPIVAHPLYDTLRSGGRTRPNPTTHAFNFRKLTSLDLELTGNAFWLKVRDRLLLPREYWRLRPDRIVAILDKHTGLIEGWAWIGRSQGETKIYLANDVVHFKYPSPIEDPYWGWSPLRAVTYAFDTDQANQMYQTKFFEAGAQLGFIISAKGEVDKETAQFVLDQFNARHQGLETMWQPVVVGGDATIVPAQALNKDIQSLELFDKTRDILLACYGVPLTKVGLANDVNLSNAEALDITFNRETIRPRLLNVEETIETDLLPDFPQPAAGRWLDFDFDNPVPGDREFELEEDTQLVKAGIRTADEVREKRGDKPFGSAYGGKVQVPLGVTLVDPLGGGEETFGINPFELEEEVLDTGAGTLEGEPRKALPAGRKRLPRATDPNETAGLALDWGGQVKHYLALVSARIAGIDATTWDRLAASLGEGIDAGETINALAGRVRDVFTEATDVRALTIARTEGMGAANAASLSGYEEGGVEGKGWLATMDAATRDWHADADGQVVPIDQPFIVDDEPMQYPGDPSGSAENTVNCRCYCTPEVLSARQAPSWTQADREAMWRAFDGRLKRYEGTIASAARGVFAGQQRSVLRVLAAHEKSKQPLHAVDVPRLLHAGLGAHEGAILAAVGGAITKLYPAEAAVGYAAAKQLVG